MKKCSYCAEDIQDAAIVCKHCGRDLTPGAPAAPAKDLKAAKKPTRISTGLGCLILLGVAFLLASMGGLFTTFDSTGRTVLPRPIGAPAPVVTKAEFDQVQEGMSYEQVARIIGARGELQSSSDLAGTRTVMYSWMNSNGSNMNAMFQNDRLITKAQFGLP